MIRVADLKRVIIHKIYPKKAKGKKQKASDVQDGYAEYSDKFVIINDSIKYELTDRIEKATGKGNKFFKLEFDSFDTGSFYSEVKDLHGCSNDDFISKTQKIADILADSHTSPTIPGGLLIIMEGMSTDNQNFIISVKAEVQTAFSLSEDKQLELVEDLFLSPAKEFYKIGLFLEETNKGAKPPNDKFSCYMYDDHFNLKKGNLTRYFCSDFLGCTTDSNDKIKTNLFFQETREFTKKQKLEFMDRKGVENALDVLFREDTSGIINPKKFAEQIFSGTKYYDLFMKNVVNKHECFKTAFSKDKSLLDRTLNLSRVRLNIGYQLELRGTNKSLDKVDLVDIEDPSKLQSMINDGTINDVSRIVLIKRYEPLSEKDNDKM